MLSPDIIRDLNRYRGVPEGTTSCSAPSINLHFSQLGVVTACCFNRTHVLGVYPKDSIDDIWHGEPIRDLRSALARYDLTNGCEKCLQQIAARDFGGSHAVFYSIYGRVTAEKRVEWGMPPEGDPARAPLPMRLEFNIHNSCNLQCIMCHGLASSSIRVKREGLAPLENPYDDAFAEQLDPYLPYVVETDFMGGEPFMVPVYFTLWQRIARQNPRMKVCILTNGTMLDDRIRNILENLNCWMHMSIDSVHKRTYEMIRRGASFDRVMEHADYYRELMQQRGLPFYWRYCPMRVNWREIPDAVQHCNEKGIYLTYNQVDSPISLSLNTLPPLELLEVIEYLEEHEPPAAGDGAVAHNRQHYLELIERFKGFLDRNNRLNVLRARLTVSDAVIGQYTKQKQRGRVLLPMLEDEGNLLVQAAKRYLTTRLNVDHARETDQDLPDEIASAVAARLEDLRLLLDDTDPGTFTKEFLNELVRTYSGVWGVTRVHDEKVFERIDRFAATLAAHPDRLQVIEGLLNAVPGQIYDLLAAPAPAEDLTAKLMKTSEQPV